MFECHVIGTVEQHDVLGRINVRIRLAYDDSSAHTDCYDVQLVPNPTFSEVDIE